MIKWGNKIQVLSHIYTRLEFRKFIKRNSNKRIEALDVKISPQETNRQLSHL